jgi:hypothetical protein
MALNEREFTCGAFHRQCGGDLISPSTTPAEEDQPLTSDKLLRGLHLLVGPGAEWTSWRQERMVTLAAADEGCHAHTGMACGSGKSMIWMAMLVAMIIAGRSRETIFVVEHHLCQL